ncbi:MAG: AAA-like domain-containing protein [Methanoregulaceae archaeon]|nr:AAA-like domain-containing protein [Methanoregulaceae archaeon]
MDSQSTFFRPGGTLEPGAECYIARKADEQLLSALLRGEYVFLLDSRQKGKSSLIARSILKLREAGVRQVKLDLQRIGANVTPEQWYAGLAVGVGQELGLHAKVLEYWQERQAVGPLARFVGVLQDVILPNTTEPLVIFVDEVDFVRALTFPTDEFFAAIRESFNRRSSDDSFKRLTFCLVGVATPGQLIRNPDISPFNIGLRIDLTDFTLEETLVYSDSLNGKRDGAKLVARVHHWVSGHPYLTQLLCGRIASEPGVVTTADVDRLVRTLFLSPESRQREPNLSDVERRMLDPDVPGLTPEERRVQVLELYGRMLRAKSVEAVEQNPVVATLRLSGVGLEHDGVLQVRNLVYRTVFDETWRRQNLPDAEVRRQAGASRRATFRTAAIAGLALLAVSAGSFGMWRLANEREQALVKLQTRTNDLKQVSDERQNALTDLQVRTGDLARTSAERQDALQKLTASSEEMKVLSAQRLQALSALEVTNKDLKSTAQGRQRALAELQANSEILQRENYAGIMASIHLALSQKRWANVSDLLDSSSKSPSRGWEWGHVKLLSGAPVFEQRFPQLGNYWNGPRFERLPDGRVRVATVHGLYDLTATGTKLYRRFNGKPFRTLRSVRGVRWATDLETNNTFFMDAETDQILAKISDPSLNVLDVWKTTMLTSGGKGSEGTCFQLRSLDGKRILASFKGTSPAIQGTFREDGTYFTSDGSRTLSRWDRDGNIIASVKVPYEPALSHGSKAKTFTIYDAVSQRIEIRSAGDLKVITTLNDVPLVWRSQMNPDETRLLVATRDSGIRLYDLTSGRLLRTVWGYSDLISQVQFLSDEHFASVDMTGCLKVWRTTEEPAIETFDRGDDPVTFAVLEANWLLMRTAKNVLVSRDMRTGREARYNKSPAEGAVSNSEKYLYAGQPDGTIERLLLDGFRPAGSIRASTKAIHRLYLLESRLIAEVNPPPWNRDTEFVVIDPESMSVVSRIEYHWPSKDRSLPDVTFSYDGRILAVSTNEYNFVDRAGQRNGVIHVYSTRTGRVITKIQRKDPIFDIALSSDGSEIYAASTAPNEKSRITVYRTDGGRLISTFDPPPLGRLVTDIWPESTGRFLAASQWPGGEWLVWRTADGKLTGRIGVGADVSAIRFSYDGERVISDSIGMPPTI